MKLLQSFKKNTTRNSFWKFRLLHKKHTRSLCQLFWDRHFNVDVVVVAVKDVGEVVNVSTLLLQVLYVPLRIQDPIRPRFTRFSSSFSSLSSSSSPSSSSTVNCFSICQSFRHARLRPGQSAVAAQGGLTPAWRRPSNNTCIPFLLLQCWCWGVVELL